MELSWIVFLVVLWLGLGFSWSWSDICAFFFCNGFYLFVQKIKNKILYAHELFPKIFVENLLMYLDGTFTCLIFKKCQGFLFSIKGVFFGREYIYIYIYIYIYWEVFFVFSKNISFISLLDDSCCDFLENFICWKFWIFCLLIRDD
jgi:hypothetical protein